MVVRLENMFILVTMNVVAQNMRTIYIVPAEHNLVNRVSLLL